MFYGIMQKKFLNKYCMPQTTTQNPLFLVRSVRALYSKTQGNSFITAKWSVFYSYLRVYVILYNSSFKAWISVWPF